MQSWLCWCLHACVIPTRSCKSSSCPYFHFRQVRPSTVLSHSKQLDCYSFANRYSIMQHISVVHCLECRCLEYFYQSYFVAITPNMDKTISGVHYGQKCSSNIMRFENAADRTMIKTINIVVVGLFIFYVFKRDFQSLINTIDERCLSFMFCRFHPSYIYIQGDTIGIFWSKRQTW